MKVDDLIKQAQDKLPSPYSVDLNEIRVPVISVANTIEISDESLVSNITNFIEVIFIKERYNDGVKYWKFNRINK